MKVVCVGDKSRAVLQRGFGEHILAVGGDIGNQSSAFEIFFCYFGKYVVTLFSLELETVFFQAVRPLPSKMPASLLKLCSIVDMTLIT